MAKRVSRQPLCLALLSILLVGCGAQGEPALTQESPAALSAGPAGSVDRRPNGAEALAPAGALREGTALAIGMPPVGSNPLLPAGVARVGATYALTPRGAQFNVPVEIAIPFDPAQIPSGAQPFLLSTSGELGAHWAEVPGAIPRGNLMHATASAAASFVVVVHVELP